MAHQREGHAKVIKNCKKLPAVRMSALVLKEQSVDCDEASRGS